MRPRARDKKLHDEWATPLNSIGDISEVEFPLVINFKPFSLILIHSVITNTHSCHLQL